MPFFDEWAVRFTFQVIGPDATIKVGLVAPFN
jgi:hypothetical protein